MEPIYRQKFTLNDSAVDCFGYLRPSMLLFYAQEVAGRHCNLLSVDWDTLAERGLFWAVIRQKVQITRLPHSGETIQVETWPMPTTKVCYPRSTVAYDEDGHELFRAISMWVLMDVNTRAMILPGKSGVTVNGMLTGSELALPGSLAVRDLAQCVSRRVGYPDLDRNGHMNNTRYLEWMDNLLPSIFHKENRPCEITICYHAEAREEDVLQMHWELKDGRTLVVDAWREMPSETDGNQRVFTAQLHYDPVVL